MTVDNRDRSATAQSLLNAQWVDKATPTEVRALLDRGADPKASDKNGWTPLHLAAQFSDPAVVTLLLDRGADSKARTKGGTTPLHGAAQSNRSPAVFTLLLDRGADPRARDKDGTTPLHRVAHFSRNPAVVALLLDRGADPQARDKNGMIPLHLAVRSSAPAVAALLLDRGANPQAQDENGTTPLHWAAAISRNPAVSALLLDRGADPQARDKDGTTPLHLAAQFNENPVVVTLLLDRGADPQARDKDGATPLHLAAQFNSASNVVALLLNRGADPRARDKDGEMPRLDDLSSRYVQYREDLWEGRIEKLRVKLLAPLLLPTGPALIVRLVLLLSSSPDVQMVKKGWSWSAFLVVLAWAFLMQSVGHVLRENPSLESLLSTIGLSGTSLLDGLILASVAVAIVPGILVLGILVIWVFPAEFIPLLAVPPVWGQMTRFHWARAVLLSLLFVVPTVWFPSGISDDLVIGLACVFACIFGRWGNGWQEQNLLRRGYEYQDTVIARQSLVNIYVRD